MISTVSLNFLLTLELIILKMAFFHKVCGVAFCGQLSAVPLHLSFAPEAFFDPELVHLHSSETVSLSFGIDLTPVVGMSSAPFSDWNEKIIWCWIQWFAFVSASHNFQSFVEIQFFLFDEFVEIDWTMLFPFKNFCRPLLLWVWLLVKDVLQLFKDLSLLLVFLSFFEDVCLRKIVLELLDWFFDLTNFSHIRFFQNIFFWFIEFENSLR